MEQKQHGMQQQQYQGPERRLSRTVYQGGYERRKAANPGMSTQERKDEQEERTRQQHGQYDDTH